VFPAKTFKDADNKQKLVEFLTPKKSNGAPLIFKKFESMADLHKQNANVRGNSLTKTFPTAQNGVSKAALGMDLD